MNLNTEICNTFNKHATEYEKAARVQFEIGERMFERLDYLKINPRFVLDLGCGTGHFSQKLKKKYPHAQIISLDIAHAMLLETKRKQGWFCKWPLVNGDMQALPFADGIFDLVFANQVVHWSFPLAKVIQELNRILNINGCLMFSTLGPDTFKELKKAWSVSDRYAHSNEFADMHDIGDSLLAERFEDPVVDMEWLTVHYANLQQLVKNIKAQGVRNINQKRNKGLTGKKAWQRFHERYEKTSEGKFPLSYEVIYGHAWKGAQRRTEKGTESYISLSEIGFSSKI